MRDGWVETPIADIAQVLSGYAFKSELFNKSEGIPLIRIRDLPKRDSTEALYSGSYEDRYVVKKGDFLIGMDGEFHCYEWNGPHALLNQRVCRIQDFKIDRVVPRYIYFAVNQYLDKIEQDTGYTTVKHISAKQVLGITIPLPPLPEQKRIVDLISSMDSYVEALEQQLESAKRSRNAVLHELLTAGGDDWVETTLHGIADVIMGQSPDGKSYNQEGKGLPFMQGSAEFGEHNPVPEKWCSDPKKIAEPGDLLLSVRAPVGDTNFADQRIAVGRGLSIIRANKESLTEFIRLVIQLNVAELIASSGGGMFASITGKNLKEFKVNLPPLPEQKRIVEIINTIDEVIAKTALATNKAKELRSGLLSDLLSGEHEIPADYDKVIGAA